MTPSELLEAFETLADAPDGVKRLRDLVLQLAVRGALVDGNQDRCLEGDGPHVLPLGWRWAPVGELGEIRLGRQRAPDNHNGPHMVPYLRVANVHEGRIETSDVKSMNFTPNEQAIFRLRHGDLLLNEGQSLELVGRPAIFRDEVPGACFQNTLLRFRPSHCVFNEYALLVFRMYMRAGRFQASAQQTTNIAHLSAKRLATIEFPLPPLAEQHRIVARVDELMGLLDRLEAARAVRDEVRRAARDAALAALCDAEDTEALGLAWTRIASQMDALFIAQEDVVPLRQTILRLGVQGRLVSQDPTDESPDKLLFGIMAEKVAKLSARTLAGEPAWQPVVGSDTLGTLPQSWIWCRLGQISLSISDGDHLPPPQVPKGIPFLTIGNVSGGRLDFETTRFVSPEYFRLIGSTRTPRVGDILYTVVGTYGRPVRVDTAVPFCVQRHIAIIKLTSHVNQTYLYYFLRSPLAYSQATRAVTGSAQPTVALRPLRQFLVPFPPFAEQCRIAAKIDALMALCDDLEARLATSHELQDKFAAAAVHHLDV